VSGMYVCIKNLSIYRDRKLEATML
jgi:hypothetical protein